MKMKPIIVMDMYLHPEAQDLLSHKCQIVMCKSNVEGEEIARRNSAVAAIVSSMWQFSGNVMAQIPSLLVIGRPGIGVDNIDLGAATDCGVVVVNTPDAPTVSTAEHAVALLLALQNVTRRQLVCLPLMILL